PMITLQHMQRIRQSWTGPLVIKGLLHPDDARQAARMGVDGIVVSNHGGRQLDAAPAPLDMLPAIREAVGDRMTLILDSGVRRGSDVAIARALGASSTIFGRPTLYAVAAGGQAGAERALQIVRNELDMVMTQIGCESYQELDGSYLWAAGHGMSQPQGEYARRLASA